MSSLKQHFEKVRAEKAALAKTHDPRLSAQRRPSTQAGRPLGNTMTRQAEPVHDSESAAEYDDPELSKLEARFFHDWEQISAIQSRQAKNDKKAEALPNYQGWIDGTLAAGTGEHSDMLLKLMVWSLDTQDLTTATRIAEYAILHDMVMPDPFTRSPAAVFAEQFADELIKGEATADEEAIARAIDITNDADMPDQIRAKLYRAYGNALKDSKADEAIKAFEKALKLDPAVGCKSDLNQLKKSAE